MLTLPLEPTDDRANPAFRNAAGCALWLGQLQLTNLHLAHGVLRTQLNESNRYPMSSLERLQTLELLRETVSSVQADYARKLIAKKLPLSEDEYTMFVSIIELWQSMFTGYQRCLHAWMAGDKPLVSSGALLCQRCLMYSGLQIFEHLRTGYEFDGKLWHQLHALYAFSEERGLQLERVDDDLSTSRQSSCHAIYTRTLLACYTRPAELTRTQLHLLDRWLTLWSPSISVERHCAMTQGEEAAPLAVDLNSAQGLQPPRQLNPSDSVRYLAMQSLSKLLRVKIILLQQGKSPQQLELGTGYNSVDCGDFLNYLHQCWCEGRGARLAERRSTAQQAQACYGLNEIYAHIANKPFEQQGTETGLDTASRRQLETFGRVLSAPGSSRSSLADSLSPLESWLIEDESILGARLLRENPVGARIGHNQLIAVLHTDAKAFMLSTVRWVHITGAGQLHAGVRYMPSVPQAIVMRSVGTGKAPSERPVAALLLPAAPALKIPASMVIPRDWFHPDRVVEIVNLDGGKVEVQMGFSVEKGLDFERVSFTPL